MVTHVAYEEIQVQTAAVFVEVVRQHVERGWQISQVRGPRGGPFLVVFRKDDDQ